MIARGGQWVVAQFALMAAVLAVGFLPPNWPEGAQRTLSVAGVILAVGGGALAVWASRTLGRSFTPFPKPVEAGLVTRGPFALIRHPVYTGGLAFFTGYSLYAGPVALVLSLVLALLWVGKLRVEERLLVQAYPEYEAYRERVRRRLLPGVY